MSLEFFLLTVIVCSFPRFAYVPTRLFRLCLRFLFVVPFPCGPLFSLFLPATERCPFCSLVFGKAGYIGLSARQPCWGNGGFARLEFHPIAC